MKRIAGIVFLAFGLAAPVADQEVRTCRVFVRTNLSLTISAVDRYFGAVEDSLQEWGDRHGSVLCGVAVSLLGEYNPRHLAYEIVAKVRRDGVLLQVGGVSFTSATAALRGCQTARHCAAALASQDVENFRDALKRVSREIACE